MCIVFVAVPLVAVSKALEHLQLLDARGDPVGLAGLGAFLLVPFAAIGAVVLAWVRYVERRPLATIGLKGPEGAKIFGQGHAQGPEGSLVCGLFFAVATAGLWASAARQKKAEKGAR
jgi:hypothetical protein